MQWQEIVESIRPLEEEFSKAYKCVNHKRTIKEETLRKHINTLINTYNTIRATLHRHYNHYTTDHKNKADEIFLKLRDKLLKIFHLYKINIKVPLSLSKELNEQITETDESDNEETENIGTVTMPRTEDDIIDKTTKIVPVFEGNINELQSFLDALTLIDKIKDEHEMVAIEVIKTKLKGHARNVITNENTIEAIKVKLQSTIKGESSELLCSKLMNIKQQTKSATVYAEEIQEITKRLGGAYIREGYPQEIAERLIRQNAAKAISKNAASDEVKLIIKTGNFNSLNDVVSKFIEASTEASVSNSSVFYFKQRGPTNMNHRNGGFNNNRGRGQNFRRNNNSFRNYSNNSRNYNGNNYRPHGNQRNNYRNQSHHPQNRGHVRLTQGDSENENSPQSSGGQYQN